MRRDRWWVSFDGVCVAAAGVFGGWLVWGAPNQPTRGFGVAAWWALTCWYAGRSLSSRR